MKKFQNKYYFNLWAVNDFISYNNRAVNVDYTQNSNAYKLPTRYGLTTYVQSLFPDYTLLTLSQQFNCFEYDSVGNILSTKTNISELFKTIYNHHALDLIDFVENKEDLIIHETNADNLVKSGENEFISKAQEWFVKFDSIVGDTYDRYSKLLNLYQNDIDDLIGTIESVETEEGQASSNAKNFFNDTPQSENVSFDTPDYASSVSLAKNEGSNLITRRKHENREYLIDLLEKVQEKYRNILDDWSKHFEKLFILRYNISEEE